MSAREIAYSIIDGFTDEQIDAFVVMFGRSAFKEDIPNAETRRILDDVRSGRNISGNFANVKELMEDLNADD